MQQFESALRQLRGLFDRWRHLGQILLQLRHKGGNLIKTLLKFYTALQCRPQARVLRLGLGSDDDEDDIDSGDSFEEALEGSPGGKRDSSSNSKANSRTNFTNALLRVGTKSTKDSSLDKPVRKGPGLLLEAAGRSLLQKASAGQNTGNKSGTSSNSSSNLLSGGATIGGLSFGLASSKISFGLYGGHLPVDHATYTTNPKSRGTR